MEKPPILSDEEIDDFCEKVGLSNADWDEGGGYVHEAVIRVIQQARTEEREEVAREIFEEIEKILEPTFRKETPLPIPNFYIRETKLQSLKDKYNKQSIGR